MNFAVLKNLNAPAVKKVAVRSFHRGVVITQKYSPEILTTVGVVGSVTSAVLASKATLKLEPIIDSTRSGVEHVHSLENLDGRTRADHVKDLTYVYYINAKAIAKLYGPSVTLGIASIGCILGAHGIMKKRNVALVAAYKSVEQTFADYRKRVAEEFGEDRERDIKRAVVKTEEVKNEETGRVETVKHIDPNGVSVYARFFDQLSPLWSPTPEYNRVFLQCQQNYANDRLKSRGHLFLNEVYEQLGLTHTKAGAVTGWVLGNGDNYVDFGFLDGNREMVREFINGNEASVLLDFNVDGIIIDKI